MFLIDNFRIPCLEWDYAVNSSSLLAYLQWTSSVLESAIWKTIYVVYKMCKTVYNNYKYFPVQCVVNQTTNDTNLELAGNLWESLLQSFRLFFVQYFRFEFPNKGQQVPESNTYECSSPTQICMFSAACSKFSLLKK